MRLFNANKTAELNRDNCDFKKGYLERSVLVIHHEAVEHVDEIGHYETLKKYPNGGRDVKWVVDVEGVEGNDAYDEEEEIEVYIPYTENELTIKALRQEMSDCEYWLSNHDYIGTKIATGRATPEEYADEIVEMNLKADRINEIKAIIENLEKNKWK